MPEPGRDLLLEVGQVARAHGLNGQVVVELWTNRAERVSPGTSLQASGRTLHVLRSSPLSNARGHERWLVSFAGVSSRADAEELRGDVLRAAPVAVDGALWVHELVGSEVADGDGMRIGVVESVEANPASDLLVLDDGKLIPLTFVTGQEPGRLTVDLPPGLLEL